MAAPRGPAHRPPELFDGPVVCRRPPAPRRAAPRDTLGGFPLLPSGAAGSPGTPCPEYASRRPAPRSPPGRPPALGNRPRGRREGPPEKEDYAPHNAPRQKPLTSGAGCAYSGRFSGNRHGPRRGDSFQSWLNQSGLKRCIRLERCRLDVSFKKQEILIGGYGSDARRALLRRASALGIYQRKLQVPQCLALNSAASAWSATHRRVRVTADQDSGRWCCLPKAKAAAFLQE